MKTDHSLYSVSTQPHAVTWKFSAVLLAFTCLTHPSVVQAQVIAADGRTGVYNSPNGVPVVDIATPNGAGLSHNVYTHYNVGTNGLVLNNGDSTQMARQSELAGQVVANLNLVPGQGADVILNEVVSTNRSLLNGFTEVLGKTADVIVANPNGITCNGCGFINSPNVTLTTGTPTVNGGGALASFNVVDGDILVTGTGLKATNQDYLALVARKLKIEGPVNANELDIVAGANTWNHISRTNSANSPTGTTPDYAVDSTALGGMYANKIRLIATEAGVGVRLLGDVAATGTDFTITAAGKVQINSKVSAERDLAITTTSNLSDAINLIDANLTANRNIAMTATGGADFSGSGIVATNDFTLNAASLTDASSDAAIADNNKRYANNALTITLSGNGTINGTNWGAAAGLTTTTGSFTIGALGATLYSSTALDMTTTTGAMILRAAYLQSVGNMTLTSADSISTESDEDQGLRVTTGNLRINAEGGLTNAGTMTTDTGNVVLRIDGTLTNSGTIHSKTTMNIADYDGGNTENISNSGTILTDDAATIIATTITNTGNWQNIKGTTLTATTLTNSGTIFASTDDDYSGTFNLATLTNQSTGTIQSALDLNLNITSTLTNSGKLLASDDLVVRSTHSGTTLAITNNSGGVMQAADLLDIAGISGGTNVNFTSQAGTVIGNDVTFNIDNLTNTGTLQAEHNMTLALATAMNNSGTVLAKNTGEFTIPTVTNSGTWQANQGFTLTGTTLTNSGTIIGSTDNTTSGTLNLTTLTNQSAGIIQSAKNLALNILTTLTNSGKILADDDLTIRGASSGSTLAITNNSGAIIQATDILDIKGASAGDNATFNTQAGTVLGNTIALNLSSFNNSGTMQSEDNSTINVTNTFTNSGTALIKKVLTLAANAFTNSGTAQATHGGSMTIAAALTNSGTVIFSNAAGYSGTITAGSLVNNASSTIQSAEDLSLTVTTSLANSGSILATDDLTIRGISGTTLAMTNASGARVQAGDVLDIKGFGGGTALSLNTQAGILLGNSLDLHLSGLNNSGTMQSEAGSTISVLDDITNSGTLLAKAVLDLTSDTMTNSGTIEGRTGTTLTATSLTNSGTVIGSTDSTTSATLNLSTLSNQSTGVIQSAKNLALNVLTSITNAGKMLASDDLIIRGANAGTTLAVTNSATGTIQATDLVDIKGESAGTNATLSTVAGSKIIGDRLGFNLSSFTNAGTTQGGTTASTVSVVNTLTNSSGGKLILATSSGGSGTVNADTITNAGTLQSAGAMALNLASTLTNSGTVISAGNMTIRGQSSTDYAVNTSSRIQSDGLLSIKGYSNTDDVDISTTHANGILLGATADIDADDVTLFNGSTLTTTGNLTMVANSLTFGGSSAAIVGVTGGTGTANITVQSALSNNAAIHSGYDLTLSALGVSNTSTGGISALHDLSITATGSNNVTNAGAFYSGNDMTVTASGDTITNSGITGTMDSGRDISLTASTIINYNDLNATRHITLTGATITNSVVGGDTRYWNNTAQDYNEEQTGHDSEGWPDNEDWWYYEATWYTRQHYADDIKPSDKPNIVGGGTVTFQNFDTASNIGGNIVGDTVTFSGNDGSTFTNNALAIVRRNYRATYNDYENCNIFDADCDFYDNENYSETITSTVTLDSVGASIRANTFNGGGFGLTNDGSPYAADTNSTSASGASGTGLSSGDNTVSGASSASGTTSASGASAASGTSATSGASAAVGTTTVGGVTALTFGGLTITLPTNPNGYFVPAANNNSSYLIETNPRFAVGSNFTGSDFMAKRLGINPDEMQKRLGDANYEAELIRKQLIDQSGGNLLNKAESEAQQMERLMTNGVDQTKQMGLKLGQPLSPSQIANLKEDMVWMVEVVVKGQKVLTPVVYLSPKTKSMFGSGDATISAGNIDLDLDSMKNTGGTISADNKMDITSKGDITNTSGTIKSGGDMNLKSTEGSIKNETLAETTGDSRNKNTVIGKTAGITAGGDLSLDAKKDITNLGANMGAGGNADLKAGGNMTFDTIKDETIKTSTTGNRSSSFGGLGGGGSINTTTESSVKNIGSNLTVGGNLKTNSGGDTTIGGSKVDVGGNADMKTGGSLNIVSRDDSKSTSSKTETSGMLFNESSKTTTDATTTNKGSSLNIGGNLKTDSKGDTTIKGSDITAGGDADMRAGGNLNIIAGQDTKTSSTTSTESGIGVNGSLFGTNADTSTDESTRNKGSSIKSGGNMSLSSEKTATIQGSNVEGGGNVDITGKEGVQVLEGRDTDTHTESHRSTSFLSIEGGSGGETSASSGAKSGNGEASAGAKASASYDAGGINFDKTTTSTSSTHDSKAVGSSIKSGGNMKIGSEKGDVTVRGSNVDAGGNVDLSGKNVNILAAEDIHTSSSSSTTEQTGLYGSSENSAAAGAGAGASSKGATGKASAHAEAGAESNNSIDLQRGKSSNSSTTDITHTKSSIKSGGNTNIDAQKTLNVVGSDVDAKGDLNLKATDINVLAAEDKHVTTSSSEKHSKGLYVDVSANASAGADASNGNDAGASAGAGAEAQAGAGLQTKSSSNASTEGSTKAQVSSLKSGGNMNRNATNKITDEGADIEAGGNFTQNAKEWESKAAKDTSFSSSSSDSSVTKVGAYVGAGAGAGANTEGQANASAGASAGVQVQHNSTSANDGSKSSTAVTGSIKSGGNFNSTTSGKTSLEGTNIEAGGDASLNAGSLDYKAAKNTSSSSSDSSKLDVDAKVGAGIGSDSVEASLDLGIGKKEASESSSQSVVGGIKSGGTLNVNTKGDARFEGTNLDSKGDTNIKAGGNVTMDAARDTESHSSNSLDVDVSLSASSEKKESGGSKNKGSAGVGVGIGNSSGSSDTATGGSMNSGGKINISSGGNATLEGTKIQSDGGTSVDAKGDVNLKAAKSTSTENSSEIGIAAKIKGGTDKETVGGAGATIDGGNASSSNAEAVSVDGGLTVKSGGKVTKEESSSSSTSSETSIGIGSKRGGTEYKVKDANADEE